MSRTISLILATVTAVAGLVALGYALDGLEYMKFFKDNLAGGAVGFLVPAVLAASAFYMAVRLFKSGFQRRGKTD